MLTLLERQRWLLTTSTKTTKFSVRDLIKELDELKKEKTAVLKEYKDEKERELMEKGHMLIELELAIKKKKGADLDLRVRSSGGTLY
ncbi:hypothetical protein BGZ95_006270 [Linnemannia exigua]|uniref:Uncharacterized protein n=1 Tax=Linnemannia exigua TaxID=604196 RepID=A0AAD4DGI8_9FUNG|nr:hypothetical protein BGZ95_006270 [Linnemannia exigua]